RYISVNKDRRAPGRSFTPGTRPVRQAKVVAGIASRTESTMSAANDPTDPALLSPDQRLAEIASILAEGVLRLRARSALASAIGPALPASDSPRIRLDDCGQTRPHGPTG